MRGTHHDAFHDGLATDEGLLAAFEDGKHLDVREEAEERSEGQDLPLSHRWGKGLFRFAVSGARLLPTGFSQVETGFYISRVGQVSNRPRAGPRQMTAPETARDLAGRHNRALLPKSPMPRDVRPGPETEKLTFSNDAPEGPWILLELHRTKYFARKHNDSNRSVLMRSAGVSCDSITPIRIRAHFAAGTWLVRP